MPNENGTEATREDAQNDYESLFGDAVDAAVPVTEVQEADHVNGQERPDSDEAEEQTGKPEELKVVVSLKEGRTTIGVQRPSSDPHIESFDDPDLSGLAWEIPEVLERARARWENALRYPAHARPAPSTRPRPRRAQGSAAQDSDAEGGAGEDQPEALRLF